MQKSKGKVKRIQVNFRQSHSERSATKSYRAFGKYQKGIGKYGKN